MQILQHEPLSRHTTFKIGGAAETVLIPQSIPDLAEYLRTNPMPDTALILGAGSNVLITAAAIQRPVFIITFAGIKIESETGRVYAEAGLPLPQLSQILQKNHLTGLEFVCGIPGTVGGAVVMNAGVREQWISSCINNVFCLDRQGHPVTVDKLAAGFGYRESIFQKERLIVVAVEFQLQRGDPAAMAKLIQGYNEKRRATQPLQYPSAGSVFKNTPAAPAGFLIEEAGGKGMRVGGALVSPQHANFIVNTGGATAADVLQLIDQVKEKVKVKLGVDLELEIKIIL
ncbi:MAG: UDP-N-acetylmuramate dehydrogenase [Candidatus Margulisiibacteriota bacterium]